MEIELLETPAVVGAAAAAPMLSHDTPPQPALSHSEKPDFRAIIGKWTKPEFIEVVSITCIMGLLDSDRKSHIALFIFSLCTVSLTIVFINHGWIPVVCIVVLIAVLARHALTTILRIEEMEQVEKEFEQADAANGIGSLPAEELGPESWVTEDPERLNQTAGLALHQLMERAAELKQSFEEQGSRAPGGVLRDSGTIFDQPQGQSSRSGEIDFRLQRGPA